MSHKKSSNKNLKKKETETKPKKQPVKTYIALVPKTLIVHLPNPPVHYGQ